MLSGKHIEAQMLQRNAADASDLRLRTVQLQPHGMKPVISSSSSSSPLATPRPTGMLNAADAASELEPALEALPVML